MQNETDLTKTKEMAELAIKHCQLQKVEYWEDATMAEAYLYLGDFKSKIYHTSAIYKCNKSIRETSSMFINAIYACNSLGRLDWKEKLMEIF